VEKAPGIELYFQSRCPQVTDLTVYYAEDKHREQTYREMASRVIDSALKKRPVAFAVYGHPTIYAYPPFLVREMAAQLGLKVKILPGISAMDCLFADLAIDPSVNGIQMFEATDILLRRHQLNSSAATLVWQIGSVCTALYSTTVSTPSRFFGFRDYLLSFYPGDHKVYSYFANPHPMLKAEIHEFTVEELPEFAEILHAAVTLYIPPAKIIREFDSDIAEVLADTNHLRANTRRHKVASGST
jgi:uncharacterized protein YabN with tetrapyrrole methylase and pyrophosphatase domain